MLQRSGWRLSLEEDYYGNEKRLLLFHPDSDLKMMARSRDLERYMYRDRFNDFRSKHMNDNFGPDFVVDRAVSNMTFRTSEVIPSFKGWDDTRPSIVNTSDMRESSIMDIPLFRKADQSLAKELIVEPQEVSQLLEQIMKMQSPEQAAIRKKRRDSEVPTACATILSFRRAA
jgi:hypothetical protein